MTGLAFYLQIPPDLHCTFGHDSDSQMSHWDFLWVKSTPIILNTKLEAVWFIAQANSDLVCISVSDHIIQGLSGNAIKSLDHIFRHLRSVIDILGNGYLGARLHSINQGG